MVEGNRGFDDNRMKYRQGLSHERYEKRFVCFKMCLTMPEKAIYYMIVLGDTVNITKHIYQLYPLLIVCHFTALFCPLMYDIL